MLKSPHASTSARMLGLQWGLILFVALSLLTLTNSCTTPTVMPTPTPTRTPRPPTPTPTLTPSPTPTPAFPITAGCAPGVPAEACARFRYVIEADPAHFAWSEHGEQAEVRLHTESDGNAVAVGSWIYAVAAPFFTLESDVESADVYATWGGTPSGKLLDRPLLVTADTHQALATLWGTADANAVTMVAPEGLLASAEAQGGWALVPFEALEPQWKVLRVDDMSLIEKEWDVDRYPVAVPLFVSSPNRPEALNLLPLDLGMLTNRDESRMTLVVLTGVTAMSRGTARLMERTSITYPAKDIKHWFADADFVHVSNEVSFNPNCVPEGTGSLSFCSHDRYIGLLEEINTNIVELTGNHLGDKGLQWIPYTLDMYRERGWMWYGGGADLADATRPITLTHNGNRIAFLGCNPSGAGFFAGENRPGAAPCWLAEQHEYMQNQVRDLRDQGYLTIVTLQHREVDQYTPIPEHIRDLRAYANAGATIVHGSQAHWAKPVEFYGDSFIHYGPGNFFFDQMQAVGLRQGFVTRYTFFDGRLLSIDLRPTLLEEFGRPRPMTVNDPAPEGDLRRFLEMIFSLRPQQ